MRPPQAISSRLVRLLMGLLSIGLLVAWSGIAAWAQGKAPATKVPSPSPQAKAGHSAPAKKPPISYVPDSTVLAKVNDKTIRAHDYVLAYFSSYPEYRPRPDSAGRVEFLETMIKKEVIARVARDAKRPLDVTDRGTLQTFTLRALSNVLYQRAVLDSVQVDEASVDSIYEQMKRRLHLQRIRFGSRTTAERIR